MAYMHAAMILWWVWHQKLTATKQRLQHAMAADGLLPPKHPLSAPPAGGLSALIHVHRLPVNEVVQLPAPPGGLMSL